MTFQPIIVGSGLVGWQFLKATQERQQAVFETSPALQRDTEYFAAEISNISTAEELVSDRRLLRVALGAFGLQDDINNRAFIERILADGATDPEALANRMTDDRYKELTRAFQFDNPFGPRTTRSTFADEIITKFNAQEFEVSVGNQDETLRLAMNLERALPDIAESSISEDAKWFRIMGTPPLRTVFETALGLPSGFGQLDIDQQLGIFKDKMQGRFGVKDVSAITEDPEVMQRVVQSFLLQSEIRNFSQTSGATVALSLLQSIPRPSLFS